VPWYIFQKAYLYIITLAAGASQVCAKKKPGGIAAA
jgi:hypothetical protein